MEQLTEYLAQYSSDSITKLSAAVASLKNNFDAYNNFNQSLLRLTASKVLDEVEEFSQKYDISEAKCDFFEEMLMRMAGITEMPTSSSIRQKDDDKTRFVINVENMQETDVSKFLNLFKSFGDETAFTGYKRARQQLQSSYSFFREEPQCAESMRIPSKPSKTNRFEVDGTLLHDKVLPAFKDFVIDLAQKDSTQLSKYQEASKDYLEAMRNVQVESEAKNSDTLFNPSKKSRRLSQSDMDNQSSFNFSS